MCTGIALYDTEHISPTVAFEIGRSFFEAIGVPVTGGSYYEYLIPGDHEGDHDIVEVPLDRLKEKIFAGEADSFWLYCERKGSVPWPPNRRVRKLPASCRLVRVSGRQRIHKIDGLA